MWGECVTEQPSIPHCFRDKALAGKTKGINNTGVWHHTGGGHKAHHTAAGSRYPDTASTIRGVGDGYHTARHGRGGAATWPSGTVGDIPGITAHAQVATVRRRRESELARIGFAQDREPHRLICGEQRGIHGGEVGCAIVAPIREGIPLDSKSQIFDQRRDTL